MPCRSGWDGSGELHCTHDNNLLVGVRPEHVRLVGGQAGIPATVSKPPTEEVRSEGKPLEVSRVP